MEFRIADTFTDKRGFDLRYDKTLPLDNDFERAAKAKQRFSWALARTRAQKRPENPAVSRT